MLILIYLIPVFQGLFVWSDIFCNRLRAEAKLTSIQTPCEAGYYCPSSSQAIVCPLNSYCAENVTVPVHCPPGYITISLGATSQDNCTGLMPMLNLRGSYNTRNLYSVHIQGWCRFTDIKKYSIMAGFIMVYMLIFCIRVLRYRFHRKAIRLFVKN
jgi:hypothetical protein